MLKCHEIYSMQCDIINALRDGNCGIWAMLVAKHTNGNLPRTFFNRKETDMHSFMINYREELLQTWHSRGLSVANEHNQKIMQMDLMEDLADSYATTLYSLEANY